MTALRSVLDAFRELDVLVVGDVLLDEYLSGGGSRLCREAPVPVVAVDERRTLPGGAGNAAAAVVALGARLRLLSVVGDDADGGALLTALRRSGVDVGDVLVEAGRRTVAKRRVVAGGQLLVRFDEGGPAALAEATRSRLLERLPELVRGVDVVVVSDYGDGVVDDEVVAAVAELQRRAPRVLVVDAREVARYRDVPATAIKPNYDEVRALLSAPPQRDADRAEAVRAEADALHEQLAAQVLAVTLDRDGAVVWERGRPPYRTWTRPVPHSRACGAGDAFTVALALALAGGADTPTAAELAQAAAQVVTGREVRTPCTLDDLRAQLAETSTRLEPAAALAERLACLQRQGRRVVFTNGCFELLHRGHVDLLDRAKALGDVLVVGLNSDASIARRTGTARPVHPLEARAQVLSALSAVDHLVAFDEPTASALVDLLRPDVYVKGGDYTEQMVPEAPHVRAYGGTVTILPYLEDRTTSALLARLRHESVVVLDEPVPATAEP